MFLWSIEKSLSRARKAIGDSVTGQAALGPAGLLADVDVVVS